MAMEISNNYGNYYAGMAADTKKESGRVSEDSKNAKETDSHLAAE